MAFPSWSRNRFRFFFLLFLPSIMGAAYLSWARWQAGIGYGPMMVHLVVLSFWTITTAFIYAACGHLLSRVSRRLSDRLSAVVPAASYLGLAVIYVSSVIGIVNWGESMNWPILRHALPDVFNIASALSLPAAYPFAVLTVPPLLFIAVFQCMRIKWGDLKPQGQRLTEPAAPVHRLRIMILSLWVCLGLYGVSVWDRPKVRNGEPVYDFFLDKHQTLPMSDQRNQSAARDLIARKSLPKQAPRVKNVILFIVDALRSDRLSLYGYERMTDPFLRSLAKVMPFHRIDTALSNGNESRGGVLATLTSKNVSAISHLNYTLSDYLVDQGFESTMILSSDQSWYNLQAAYGKSIHRLVHGGTHPGPHGNCDDDMLISEATELPPAGDKHHFFYFHLMSVHELGYLQPHFRDMELESVGKETRTGPKAQPTNTDQAMVAFYDQRVRQADDVIRQIMAQLQIKGYLRDAICVVTADHGEMLGETNMYGHGRSMARPALQIPILFFGSAALPEFHHSDFAVQLDIAPTIVDLVGLRIPSSWQGRSLCRDATNSWSYHECTFLYKKREDAVVYRVPPRVLKYSFSVSDPENHEKQRLYDLISDPAEKNNLIDSPTVSAQLLQEIRGRAHEHFASE